MGMQNIAFVAGFPNFLASIALSGVLLLIAVAIYVKMTPWKEWTLINEKKNASAGLALVGAVIGLALPVAANLASSLSLFEMLIWGVVVMFVQLTAYRISEMFMKDLRNRIQHDEAGPAIVLLGVKVAIGIIVAAGIADPVLPSFF